MHPQVPFLRSMLPHCRGGSKVSVSVTQLAVEKVQSIEIM